MTFWQKLDSIDKVVFTFVHSKAAMPSLDWLMLIMRNGATWIPLYAFMLYWILRNGKKDTWKFILLTLVCFGITDYVCVEVLRPLFHRLRPCHEASLQPVLRNIIDCGGWFSLPSAHASNHFGLASFWFLSIKTITGKKWHWLWVWAFVICYAQVYVGKHYPFDVLLGGILGTGTGILIFLLFKRWSSIPK